MRHGRTELAAERREGKASLRRLRLCQPHGAICQGTFYEGGVRGTGWVHGKMLAKQKTTNGLMHVTDWVPTLVAAAGGVPNPPAGKVLDGANQWPLLTQGAPSGREDLAINWDKRGAFIGGGFVVGDVRTV